MEKQEDCEAFVDLKEEVDFDMAKKAREELVREDPSLKEFFDHPINNLEITEETMDNPLF